MLDCLKEIEIKYPKIGIQIKQGNSGNIIFIQMKIIGNANPTLNPVHHSVMYQEYTTGTFSYESQTAEKPGPLQGGFGFKIPIVFSL